MALFCGSYFHESLGSVLILLLFLSTIRAQQLCANYLDQNSCEKGFEATWNYESQCHWCTYDDQPWQCTNDRAMKVVQNISGYSCSNSEPMKYCLNYTDAKQCDKASESNGHWKSSCTWCSVPSIQPPQSCVNSLILAEVKKQPGANCSSHSVSWF